MNYVWSIQEVSGNHVIIFYKSHAVASASNLKTVEKYFELVEPIAGKHWGVIPKG